MNKALSAALALAGLIALAPMANEAQAKLPAPTPEAKAKADEAKAKTAWSDKVAAYKLCLAQDKVAADYFKHKGAGKKPSMPMPACVDPGPYVAQVAEVGVADSKPVPEAGSKQPPPQKK